MSSACFHAQESLLSNFGAVSAWAHRDLQALGQYLHGAHRDLQALGQYLHGLIGISRLWYEVQPQARMLVVHMSSF